MIYGVDKCLQAWLEIYGLITIVGHREINKNIYYETAEYFTALSSRNTIIFQTHQECKNYFFMWWGYSIGINYTMMFNL